MVQRPIQQGDFSFPREGNGWSRIERSYLDTTPQDNRFANATSSIHPRCLVCTCMNVETSKLTRTETIEAALRECARIPVKEFGLVVTLENGEEKTYTSSSLAPYRQRFFTDQFHLNFRRAVRKTTDDAYSSSSKSYPSVYPGIIADPTVSSLWSRWHVR
jgi:hypothetical protein